MKAASTIRAAAPAAAPIASASRLGVFGPHALLSLLFDKARPQLDAADMAWLTDGCTTLAQALASRNARLASGIGCLVAHDASQDLPGAGNFQHGSDVAELLFLLGDQFALIEGLVEVGWVAAEAAGAAEAVESKRCGGAQ